jgi:uncharacterized RDD family membrane protein YckC
VRVSCGVLVGVFVVCGICLAWSRWPIDRFVSSEGLAVRPFMTGLLEAMARLTTARAGAVTLGLGFLWIGFDSEKRGLHDWLSGTYVVKA